MPDGNQKDISRKYWQDLRGYQKTHPMRRLRFWLCVAFFVGGLVWACGFYKLGGTSQFFNTGPISLNHQHFQDDCAKCHTGASTDVLAILPVGAAKDKISQGTGAVLASLKEAGNDIVSKASSEVKEAWRDPHEGLANLGKSMEGALSKVSLDNIDRACLNCHAGFSLHQPGALAITARETVKEMSLVSAGACSSCHMEHKGPGKMVLPTSQTCVDCHGDPAKLKDSFAAVAYHGRDAKPHSQNWRVRRLDVMANGSRTPGNAEPAAPTPGGKAKQLDSRDWTIQWVPAAATGVNPKLVKGFAGSSDTAHPAFLYEPQTGGSADSKPVDKAAIQFNHALHVGTDPKTGARIQAKDIPLLKGEVLDCRHCHSPDPDGVGMVRVSYDQHCSTCHPLRISNVGAIDLPHRNPAFIRKALEGLKSDWKRYVESTGRVTAQEAAQLVEDIRNDFLSRWKPEEGIDRWVERVLFEGYPSKASSPAGQTLPACIKCHSRGPAEADWAIDRKTQTVELTALPDQWLSRGPFKHAAHGHMECLDCHKAAENSSKTTDILLPGVKSCAECHRPLDVAKLQLKPELPQGPTFGAFDPAAARKQREFGGVFHDCLGCHKYHVPAAEMDIARALRIHGESK